MEQKTKNELLFVQIATVIGFASVCGMFYYLDGGNPTEEIVNTEITIPEYQSDKTTDNSRIASYETALAIEHRKQEVQDAQKEFNTFDFFNNEADVPEQTETSIEDRIAQLEAKIGERLCTDALDTGIEPVEIIVTEKNIPWAKKHSAGALVTVLSDDCFRKIASTVNPQGIACIVNQPS